MVLTCLQIRIAQKQNQPELQDNDSAKELQEPIPESSSRETFATIEELNNGKLPPEEILSLPKFKVLYSSTTLLLSCYSLSSPELYRESNLFKQRILKSNNLLENGYLNAICKELFM